MPSATKLNGEAESQVSSHAATRPDPVPLEVPVNATGARPTEPNAPRELFSEDTTTVLLFHDGAVIRLNAAVLQGQLVFLTNKQTNREVVCQVVRKRSFRPTSSYVELQFTEQQQDFWGDVKFEENSADEGVPGFLQFSTMPNREAEEEATELVQQAEIVEDDISVQKEAPSAQEVELLRDEVEALRKQLLSMQSAPPPVVAPPPPIVRMTLPDAPAASSGEAAFAQTPSSTSLAEPRAQRPAAAQDPEQDAVDELLPGTSLDFSKAPRTHASAGASMASPTSGKTLIILVSLLLVVGGAGVAWSLELIPFGRRPAQPSAVAVPAVNQPVKPTTAKSAAAQPAASTSAANPAPATISSNGNAADSSAAPAATSARGDSANSASGNDVAAQPAANESKEQSKPSALKRLFSFPRGSDANKTPSATDAPAPSASGAPHDAPGDDGTVVPAKLVKSVQPVYPPDAMRNYITGDVKLNALVDAKGHVKSAEVLLGPAPLQQAALDTVKKYEYTPATKGNHAVDSHVEVTIKFWFNP